MLLSKASDLSSISRRLEQRTTFLDRMKRLPHKGSRLAIYSVLSTFFLFLTSQRDLRLRWIFGREEIVKRLRFRPLFSF